MKKHIALKVALVGLFVTIVTIWSLTKTRLFSNYVKNRSVHPEAKSG